MGYGRTILHRKMLFAGCSLLAAAFAAAPAVAQEASSQTSARSDDSASGIGDIVVTAQRREQRLTEVPVSVQAVSSQTLDRAAFTNTNDLVKLTPSVRFVAGSNPTASSVAIRGIASKTEEGGVQPSTAVVVDEVPYSRQAEFVADFADIERIEVLRGPQGTLFGKNATAGVINIVTRAPTDRYEGSVEGGYSTDGEKLLRGIVNIPLGEGIRVRVNGFWRSQDHLIDNVATLVQTDRYKNNGGNTTYGLQAKIAVDLSDSVDLLVSADFSKQRSAYGAIVVLQGDTLPSLNAIQRAAGVIADRDHPFINSDSGADSKSRAYGVSANLTANLSDSWTLKSVTAYRNFRNDYVSDADSGPWGAWSGVGILPNPLGYPVLYVMEANGGLPRAPDFTHYFSEELRLNYSSDRLDLVMGGFVQFFRDHKHNSVPFLLNGAFFAGDPTTPYYYNNTILDAFVDDDVYSAFADATFKLNDKFSLFGGLRYTREKLKLDYTTTTWFTSNFDPITILPAPGTGTTTSYVVDTTKSNLSGRAGIRYAPSPEQSFYFTFSRGYKGPATNIARGATAATAFLKPEIATAFELGSKSELMDRRVLLNIALFYQQTKDIQQSALIPGQGTATLLQNAGDIRAYGTEIELAGKVTDAFRIDAGLAYTHAEYRGLSNIAYPGQPASDPRCTIVSTTDPTACAGQNLTGTRSNGSPRWAGNIAGTYDIATPQSMPFDAYVRVAYSYVGSIQYGLTGDPLLRERPHGSLDVTLGLTGKEDRWELLLYGRNLTDERFYENLFEANNFIARQMGNYTRDFKRYGGVMLKAKF